MKAAIRLRVSTGDQNTENELPDLEGWAFRRGLELANSMELLLRPTLASWWLDRRAWRPERVLRDLLSSLDQQRNESTEKFQRKRR